MDRLIHSKLLEWKNKPNRKPLIIRGARQTGKSWSVEHLGKSFTTGSAHIINFEKRPDWHTIFEENFDVTRIITELELLLGKKIYSGHDLLFFDEIQACPKAIASLRYFYEEMPELHIVAAGSLLEFVLDKIPFPVGRVQLMDMFPMTFFEFLVATGNETAAGLLQEPPKKLSDPVNKLLHNELRKYFFIGGMPECVNIYAETESMANVFDIQSELIATFRQDFSKYAGRADKQCLDAVLSSVPQQIGQQIKYSTLAESFSNPTIKKAFELLETARIFKKVRATSPSGLPLGAGASEKKFKVVFLDIGLMANMNGLNIGKEYQKTDLLTVFRGAMAEQFIGQELLAYSSSGLFYWSREAKSSNAETDYLMESNSRIIPIEVKSGKAGSLKSLHLLLNSYPNIQKSVVLSEAQFGISDDQKIVYLPLYYAGAIDKMY
jgi:uncharacterized protein